MANIEIYTTPVCPYCSRAKSLLTRKGASFTEIDVWSSPDKKREMIARAGGRTTVPQIFINGEHVGGCDDIHALDRDGALDPKLAA